MDGRIYGSNENGWRRNEGRWDEERNWRNKDRREEGGKGMKRI